MRIKFFLSSILLFFVFQSWAKSGILNRLITVEIKSTPIRTVLTAIEEYATVKFSYNPSLIEENKVVSLSIQNKTVAFGLSLIFNETIRFKEVADHIILLRNESNADLRKRKKENLSVTFKGLVTDRRTGAPIGGASIYDVDARYAAISDANGNYELIVPKEEAIRSLYIRKKGFKEFVFVADATVDSEIVKNVKLEPQPVVIEKIDQREVESVFEPIENRVLSGELVSYDTYVHTENLGEIKEERIAQISLVPSVGIGSNLSTNGLITNNFSCNILAGYSNGLNGVEIGGILNIVKGDARWVQMGGIANLVGEGFYGAQFGGIANSVRGDFYGAQFGGLFNNVRKDFVGFQAGGVGTLTHGDFLGVQAGGIAALNKGQITGVQMGGIFSAARCGFEGIQISGISSVADSVSYGLQISGISGIVSGKLIGGQFSGISNFSYDGVNFLQIAGIANIADKNNGLQIGGILNFAHRNNGLQIGLINTSIKSRGVSLGLINFVVKGYHKTEVSANETFPVNITLKSGIRPFYNTYHFSFKPGSDPTFAAGLGFGTCFSMSKRFELSIDLSGQMAFKKNQKFLDWTQLVKFSPTVDYKLAEWITIFAGPTLNTSVNLNATDGITDVENSDLGWNPIYEENDPSFAVKAWVGGRVGFRF